VCACVRGNVRIEQVQIQKYLGLVMQLDRTSQKNNERELERMSESAHARMHVHEREHHSKRRSNLNVWISRSNGFPGF